MLALTHRDARLRLWLIPLAGLAVGGLLALGTLAIDRATGYDLLSGRIVGRPGAARTLLARPSRQSCHSCRWCSRS